MKAKFGYGKGSSAFSLNSREGTANDDYNTLVSAKPQAFNQSSDPELGSYELGRVEHGKEEIRVQREIDVISTRNKTPS